MKSLQLQSARVYIQPTEEKDLSKILGIEKRNVAFVAQNSLEQHRAMLGNNDKLHCSIFTVEEKEVVGYVILEGMESEHKSLLLKRIAIDVKGKGYGREVLRLIKQLCFEQLKFHRLWLDVFEDNTRALHLYQTEDFVKEGLMRECFKGENEYRSMYLMSILEQDYLAK